MTKYFEAREYENVNQEPESTAASEGSSRPVFPSFLTGPPSISSVYLNTVVCLFVHLFIFI